MRFWLRHTLERERELVSAFGGTTTTTAMQLGWIELNPRSICSVRCSERYHKFINKFNARGVATIHLLVLGLHSIHRRWCMRLTNCFSFFCSLAVSQITPQYTLTSWLMAPVTRTWEHGRDSFWLMMIYVTDDGKMYIYSTVFGGTTAAIFASSFI